MTTNQPVDIDYTADYLPYGGFQPQSGSSGTTQPEDFTSKERDDELGLNWHYFGARYYRSRVGLWNSIDPLWDKFPQWSPYTYTADNPIAYNDPDGRILNLIIGGVSDYAIQVATNIAQGCENCLTENISLGSIGVSIAAGAASSGISTATKAIEAVKLARSVEIGANMVISAGESAAQQKIRGESIDLGEVALDMSVSGLGTKIGQLAEDAAQASKTGKALHEAAKKASNKAADGMHHKAAQTMKAAKLATKANNYGSGPMTQSINALATGAVSEGLQSNTPAKPSSVAAPSSSGQTQTQIQSLSVSNMSPSSLNVFTQTAQDKTSQH